MLLLFLALFFFLDEAEDFKVSWFHFFYPYKSISGSDNQERSFDFSLKIVFLTRFLDFCTDNSTREVHLKKKKKKVVYAENEVDLTTQLCHCGEVCGRRVGLSAKLTLVHVVS